VRPLVDEVHRTVTSHHPPSTVDGDRLCQPCFSMDWVEQMLAPTLQPGHVVVMDNLPAHKVAASGKH